jgi:hypothetical protein
VRHFSSRAAQQFGGSLIRMNVREPDVSAGTGVGLALPALMALQAIDTVLSPP